MGANDLAPVKSFNHDLVSLSQEISNELKPDSFSRSSTDEVPKIADASGQEEQKYLTGVKLFLVASAVTLVCFLVLLDTAIIVTACFDSNPTVNKLY